MDDGMFTGEYDFARSFSFDFHSFLMNFNKVFSSLSLHCAARRVKQIVELCITIADSLIIETSFFSLFVSSPHVSCDFFAQQPPGASINNNT